MSWGVVPALTSHPKSLVHFGWDDGGGVYCESLLRLTMLAASRQLAHKECETMSFITNPAHVTAPLLAIAMLTTCTSTQAQVATNGVILNAESLAPIHKKIRPQPGESRWMQIPWLTDLHEARRKAAAEGKPLFLMVSGKGISIGMC
jgi:hypothetical protein